MPCKGVTAMIEMLELGRYCGAAVVSQGTKEVAVDCRLVVAHNVLDQSRAFRSWNGTLKVVGLSALVTGTATLRIPEKGEALINIKRAIEYVPFEAEFTGVGAPPHGIADAPA